MRSPEGDRKILAPHNNPQATDGVFRISRTVSGSKRCTHARRTPALESPLKLARTAVGLIRWFAADTMSCCAGFCQGTAHSSTFA
jgi:hypothetical protein